MPFISTSFDTATRICLSESITYFVTSFLNEFLLLYQVMAEDEVITYPVIIKLNTAMKSITVKILPVLFPNLVIYSMRYIYSFHKV